MKTEFAKRKMAVVLEYRTCRFVVAFNTRQDHLLKETQLIKWCFVRQMDLADYNRLLFDAIAICRKQYRANNQGRWQLNSQNKGINKLCG